MSQRRWRRRLLARDVRFFERYIRVAVGWRVNSGGGVEDILARLKAWRNDLQAKSSYSELAAGIEGVASRGLRAVRRK